MSLLKKIAIAIGVILGILIIAGIIIGILAVHQVATPPAKFNVNSIEIVDYDGYPAIRLAFETEKYPIDFYLLTPDGEKLDYKIAMEPEKVKYLYLTSFKPYTNIIGKRIYMIKAYYLNEELWNKTIIIEGVKPEINIINISITSSIIGLSIDSIVIRVKNLGDVPLYITTIPENIVVYLDGKRKIVTLEGNVTVLPGREEIIIAKLLFADIDYKDIDKEHTLEVDIAGTKANSAIPPANIELKLGEKRVEPWPFGSSADLHINISIANRGTYPIHINWIRVFEDGKENSIFITWIPDTKKIIEPGEIVTYRFKYFGCTLGSTIDFYIGNTKLASTKCG